MSVFNASSSPWTSRMLSVLRIVAGLLYFEHGLQKVFNFPPSARGPVPYDLFTLTPGFAGLIETVCGFLILIGFVTRGAAFLASGEMAAAYFKVHILRSLFPINNMGDNVVLYCFIFLYLVFAGAGPWSVDALVRRPRARPPETPAQRDEIPAIRPRREHLEAS
ncbi:MAG TPA: DoxX family protein [Gemmatimonadaceae bacterium]|nr:DoxX family protein [Gemmatimonadaceae bacterium]